MSRVFFPCDCVRDYEEVKSAEAQIRREVDCRGPAEWAQWQKETGAWLREFREVIAKDNDGDRGAYLRRAGYIVATKAGEDAGRWPLTEDGREVIRAALVSAGCEEEERGPREGIPGEEGGAE